MRRLLFGRLKDSGIRYVIVDYVNGNFSCLDTVSHCWRLVSCFPETNHLLDQLRFGRIAGWDIVEVQILAQETLRDDFLTQD